MLFPLCRYHHACAKAKVEVLELLKELSAEMQDKINILVFSSIMLVIAKALFSHVRYNFITFYVFLCCYVFFFQFFFYVLHDCREIIGLSLLQSKLKAGWRVKDSLGNQKT